MKKITYGAVLTGDIVGSSKLGAEALDLVRFGLLEALAKFRATSSINHDCVAVIGDPEFFRGDSWQVLVGDPALALRAALFVRATLIASFGSDTRISIAIGAIDSVNEKRISMSLGPAFEASGQNLDMMLEKHRLFFQIVTDKRGELRLSRALKAGIGLIDMVVSNWTRRQAEAVSIVFAPEKSGLLTYEEIGERMQITRQTVQGHFEAAHWDLVHGFEVEFTNLFDEDIA